MYLGVAVPCSSIIGVAGEFSKKQVENTVGEKLELSYKGLAKLNQIISIALLSGKIELDETTEAIHKKVAEEIVKMTES